MQANDSKLVGQVHVVGLLESNNLSPHCDRAVGGTCSDLLVRILSSSLLLRQTLTNTRWHHG
jgi:hypothetical protein